MTYEQYWNGNPYLARDYRKAAKLQIERRNQELWLQGLYIYNAFGVALSNAFAKKGSKTANYLEEPIDIFPKSEKEKAQKAEAEREKIIAKLTLWKTNWDAAHGAKHGNNH